LIVLDPQTTALLSQLGVDAGLMESLMSGAIAFTVVTLIAAVPTGIIAKQKGRSTTLWLIFALSIPVIPLLLVWLLPAVGPDKPPPQQ
jgi:RsiW-degrading membrane proteinase PrsW (M82 family)